MSSGSHPALAVVNLRPGCPHRTGDKAEGTRGPGAHANNSQIGSPGSGRASDPVQSRMAELYLLNGYFLAGHPEDSEAGTLVTALTSGQPQACVREDMCPEFHSFLQIPGLDVTKNPLEYPKDILKITDEM